MLRRAFFWSVTLLIATSSILSRASEPEQRVLLLLKTGAKISVLRKALPKGTQVVAAEGPLILIALKDRATPGALSRLRKLPGVQAVQRDQVAYALTDCPDCAPKRDTRIEPLADNVETLNQAIAGPKACPLAEICSSNSRSRWWAQDAIDADLMKAKVARILSGKPVTVPVAVVDTGFDRSQESSFDSVGGVKTAPGAIITDKHPVTGGKLTVFDEDKDKPLIGNPNTDEGGHGTMVSSVIAGKGKLGVGSGVSLSIYRVTAPGDAATTSGAILDISAYRACTENRDPEGLTIVNMSWGSRLDEAGLESDEEGEVKAKLIELFGKMGCLLVKAAGNDAFRKDYDEKLDDAYLRVAAIDPSRQLADFSSTGEIAAPGSNVYVIESAAAADKAGALSRCDAGKDADPRHERRFVSGTSFAAPITAAVASQVVRVLKTGSAFKKLAPPDRIVVVNRLLKASMIDHSINALRAVTLAERWNTAAPGADASVEKLAELLDSPRDEGCSRPLGSCRAQSDCNSKLDCVTEARRRIAVCSDASADTGRDLALSFLDAGDYEDAYRFSSWARATAKSGDPGARDVTRAVVESYLNGRGFNWKPVKYEERSKNKIIVSDMELNFMKSQLKRYFNDCAAQGGCDKPALTTMLQGALNAVAVSTSTRKGVDKATGEDRGSGSTLDAVSSMLKDGRKILGDAAVDKIVTEYFTSAIDWLKKTRRPDGSRGKIGRPPEVYARILDSLVTGEKDGSKSEALYRMLERDYLKQLMKMNEYFRANTQELALFGESYPTRASFDGMIARNADLIDHAIAEGSLSELAPVQIFALFDGMDTNPGWKPKSESIALDVMRKIASGSGWGEESDNELFERALQRLADSPDPDARKKIFSIIAGSRNLSLLTYLSRRYQTKATLGSDSIFVRQGRKEYSYSDYPGMDHAVMQAIAPRIALALLSATPAQRSELSYESIVGVRFAVEQLIGDRSAGASEGTSLQIPLVSSIQKFSRFSPQPLPQAQEIEMPARAKLLDDLAGWALQLLAKSTTRKAATSLVMNVFNPINAKAVASLASLSGWKKAASELLADSAQNPGKYDAKAISQLKDFVAAAK